MTPLEIVGGLSLGWILIRGALVVLRTRGPELIEMKVAQEHLAKSMEEAFQSGMLCAADIVTHEGHEETAGRIRQTVQYVRDK